VLAAVIRDGDRYLICRRPAHKRHGGLWEFPGGKMDPGETALEAARRELGEELGVQVRSVEAPRFVRQDPGSRYLIEFVHVEIAGTAEAREHEEVRWATVEQIGALALAPTDRAFVEACLNLPPKR
jgi:8-oxo-dGTP diphosphatase